MREAVVLVNGYIVYLDTITDHSVYDPENTEIVFSRETGRVIQFRKNEVTYMALFSRKHPFEFKYYAKAIDFWTSSSPTKANSYATNSDAGESSIFKVKVGIGWDIINQYGPGVDTGHGVEEGTEVIMVIEELNYDTTNSIKVHKKTFTFPNRNLKSDEYFYNGINFNGELIINFPINTNFNNPLNTSFDYIEKYSESVFNKAFFNKNTGEFYFPTDNILDEITFLLVKLLDYNVIFYNYIVSENLKPVFDKHFELIHSFDPSTTYGGTPFYYENYTEKYFNLFRIRLIELNYWSKSINEFNDFNYKKVELLVRIISLFESHELALLPYDIKIQLLKDLTEGNWWFSGRWDPFYSGTNLTEEEVIVKIVNSIARYDDNGYLNYGEIDSFLELLNSVAKYTINEPRPKTYYEILYDGLDDDILLGDNGRGAKGQFVKAVYNLWYNSKFNPYHENPILAALALNNFTYTPYHCRWQHEDSNILLPVPDYEASPMIINYESEKKFLWYIDNFKFEFFKNKIIAREDVTNYGLQPYGVYDIFQPISLKGVNPSGTIIRMPVLNMPNGATNPNDYIKNCLPIFYLMYVDDVGDRSDAKETIGTAINVALTFWGIGGVISNLRHLRSLSLVTRIGTLNAAEKVAFGRALSGLISASEAFFGAASFFHDFATSSCTIYYNTNNPPNPSSPEYQAYLKCKRIDNWLFALEMLSLSGDLLAKRALRHASRELAQSLGNDVPLQHRQIIDELADLDGLLDDFLNRIEISHPNIHARVSNFADEDKKFAFMFDFENAPASVLDDLNIATNPSLIDTWDEITHLSSKRKSVKFLKSYKSIKSNADLLTHVHDGHPRIKRVYRNGVARASKGKITGSHNLSVLRNPPPPPLLPGEMSWQIPPPVGNSNPLNPSLGYQQGTVQRNMNDMTDPATGTNFVNSTNNIVKKEGNVYFPESYLTSRINEEIAYAHSQIDFNLPFDTKIAPDGSHSFFFRGQASDGHMLEMIYNSPNSSINSATLKTAYPLKFQP